jgi:hypothetical protein
MGDEENSRFTYDLYHVMQFSSYRDILEISHCIEDDTVSFVDIIADFQDNDIPTPVGDYMDDDFDEDYFWNKFETSEYNRTLRVMSELGPMYRPVRKTIGHGEYETERIYIRKELIAFIVMWLLTDPNRWFVRSPDRLGWD